VQTCLRPLALTSGQPGKSFAVCWQSSATGTGLLSRSSRCVMSLHLLLLQQIFSGCLSCCAGSRWLQHAAGLACPMPAIPEFWYAVQCLEGGGFLQVQLCAWCPTCLAVVAIVVTTFEFRPGGVLAGRSECVSQHCWRYSTSMLMPRASRPS